MKHDYGRKEELIIVADQWPKHLHHPFLLPSELCLFLCWLKLREVEDAVALVSESQYPKPLSKVEQEIMGAKVEHSINDCSFRSSPMLTHTEREAKQAAGTLGLWVEAFFLKDLAYIYLDFCHF